MHNAYQLRSQTTSIHHSLERQGPPHLSKDAFVSLIPAALPANRMNEPHLTHSICTIMWLFQKNKAHNWMT